MQFEENKFNNNIYDIQPKGFPGWLIKKGVVKDIKGANKVMIIIIFLVIILTIFILNLDSVKTGEISDVEVQFEELDVDDPAVQF